MCAGATTRMTPASIYTTVRIPYIHQSVRKFGTPALHYSFIPQLAHSQSTTPPHSFLFIMLACWLPVLLSVIIDDLTPFTVDLSVSLYLVRRLFRHPHQPTNQPHPTILTMTTSNDDCTHQHRGKHEHESHRRRCVVCLDDIHDENDVCARLPCGHDNFHVQCINTWLAYCERCPLCAAHPYCERDRDEVVRWEIHERRPRVAISVLATRSVPPTSNTSMRLSKWRKRAFGWRRRRPVLHVHTQTASH